MTKEEILKREGNIIFKKRGGNFIVYILPFMERQKTFIDEQEGEGYFNKLVEGFK